MKSKIIRQLPRSKKGVLEALTTALYMANNPGPNGNFLTAATFNRLMAHTPLMVAAMKLVAVKEGLLFLNTRTKKPALKDCKKACSDFVLGVNLAIRLGVFTVADRAYYGLSLKTGKMPVVRKSFDLKSFAEKLISGEAARMLDGRPPMVMPAIGNVQAKLAVLLPLLSAEDNLKQEVDNAQEAVDELIPEAKKIVRKVWDEAETRYNEEARESKRANCRQWGVVYVSRVKTPINIAVRNQVGDVLTASTGTIKQTGKPKKANAQGVIPIVTNVAGPVDILVECPGYQSAKLSIVIKPGIGQDLEVQLNT